MTNENNNDNDFKEYRRLIISELEDLNCSIKELREATQEIDKELAVIKTKIAFVSAGLGFAGGLIGPIVHFLLNHFFK